MKGYIIHQEAEHRLHDFVSEETSSETKVSAARWYTEMMIDKFFSKDLRNEIGQDEFNRMTLERKINRIKVTSSKELIDSLFYIKQFGDIGSHYRRGQTPIAIEKAEDVVRKALGLFDIALIDLLKNGGLAKTPYAATIFSTFLPAVRVRVLTKIIDFNKLNCRSEYDMGLLDKLLLALIKDNKRNKAFRILDKLGKDRILPDEDIFYWKERLTDIENEMRKGNLPIANDIYDCKRNLDDLVSKMSEVNQNNNKELIEILNTMLEQVIPSDWNDNTQNIIKYY